MYNLCVYFFSTTYNFSFLYHGRTRTACHSVCSGITSW